MATQNPEGNGPDLDSDIEGQGQVQEQEQPQGVNLNPAWNPLLETIPEDFHTLVAPTLQSWDKNFQDKVSSLQADLDKYKDWEDFVEHDVDPGQAQAALEFAVMLEEDPQGTIEKLANHFKVNLGGSAQGTKTPADDDDDDYDDDDLDDVPEDITKHPAFQELLQKQQELQEHFQSREQESAIEQLEAQLDEYLEELHEDHGDFDETYVLALFQNGYEMEEAVKFFKSNFPNWTAPAQEGQEQQQQPQAPQQPGFVPMGNGGSNVGGGVPVQPSKQFGKMGKQDVNAFVANLAASMKDQDD